MYFKNITIGRRVALGFGILLLSSLLTGLVALRDINNLWKDTENLYKHPFTVSNAVRDVRFHIVNIRRYMLDIALDQDAIHRARYLKMIEREDSLAHRRFEDIFRLYLGDLSDIEAAHTMMEDWKKLRAGVIEELIRTHNSDLTVVIRPEHLQFVV